MHFNFFKIESLKALYMEGWNPLFTQLNLLEVKKPHKVYRFDFRWVNDILKDENLFINNKNKENIKKIDDCILDMLFKSKGLPPGIYELIYWRELLTEKDCNL